jgi:hypothetical protein
LSAFQQGQCGARVEVMQGRGAGKGSETHGGQKHGTAITSSSSPASKESCLLGDATQSLSCSSSLSACVSFSLCLSVCLSFARALSRSLSLTSSSSSESKESCLDATESTRGGRAGCCRGQSKPSRHQQAAGHEQKATCKLSSGKRTGDTPLPSHPAPPFLPSCGSATR